MATNQDPQSSAILQAHLRPAADRMSRLYYDIKEQRAQSMGQNWGAAYTGPPEDVISDPGASVPVTNYDALAVLSVMDALLSVFEANNDQNLTLVLSVRKV